MDLTGLYAPEVVLSKGTVSAIQNKERNTPMVLHSADISAGNSGGPLIDSCGRGVGINTYIVTVSRSPWRRKCVVMVA